MPVARPLRFLVPFLVFLLAVTVVGVIIYESVFQALRQETQLNLNQRVGQTARLIDAWLDQQFRLLDAYSSLRLVRSGTFPEIPSTVTDGENFLRLVLFDDRGRGMTNKGQSLLAAQLRYFQRAKTGEEVIQGPLRSPLDGSLVFVFARPLRGLDSNAAVLGAEVSLESLKKIIVGSEKSDPLGWSLQGPGGLVFSSNLISGSDRIRASALLKHSGWSVSAEVSLADSLSPVRGVLLLVGTLIVLGAVLLLYGFWGRRRHRRKVDELRDDRTQALKEAYSQLRKLAYYDPATRLPNRQLATRTLGEQQQLQSSGRVALLSLAHLRRLTATFGPRFLDRLLKEAASRIQAVFEGSEGVFVARLEASEFLLWIPEAVYDRGLLQTLMDRLSDPLGPDGGKLPVAAYVGVCRIEEGGKTPDQVIQSAETALNEARERGPGQIVELYPAAVLRRQRKAALQQAMAPALERGEFSVVFQPQVEPLSGTVRGYEALSRWNSPQLGSISPVEFIPLAEESGLIVRLGEAVLDEGLAFALRLLRQGADPVPTVSVNVSPVQFLQTGFFDRFEGKFRKSGLKAHSMGIEVTESLLVVGLEQVRPGLERLIQAGFEISLDDFGTGYSSFAALKDLPLTTLKLDRGFLNPAADPGYSATVVQGLVSIARQLNLKVVVEGVETSEHWNLVCNAGADLIQGYLTGRPASPDLLLEPRRVTIPLL